MKLQDAATLVAFLWGTHPNAPRQTQDERDNTIAAYFYALWDYSIQDAMAGAHAACIERPGFVPTAYEIRAKCVKTYDMPWQDSIRAEMLETIDKMAIIIMDHNPMIARPLAEALAGDPPLGIYPDPFDALACAYKSAKAALSEMEKRAALDYDIAETAQAAPGLKAALNVQPTQRAICASNKAKANG